MLGALTHRLQHYTNRKSKIDVRGFKVDGQVINLLTLVGLWTVFGLAGPSVTNLLTLAGLWTFFGYNHGLHVSRFATPIRKVSINLPRSAGL